MKLLVEPFYGWGWFDAEGKSVNVPEEFHIDIEVIETGCPFQSALGKLEEPNHTLSGNWILFSQRHDPFDGQCNLRVFREKPQISAITKNPSRIAFVFRFVKRLLVSKTTPKMTADISWSGFAQCTFLSK